MKPSVSNAPFDLVKLQELWTNLPHEYRLEQLDLKMKLSNIRNSWLSGLLEQQGYDNDTIIKMATECVTASTFSAYKACNEDPVNNSWRAVLDLINSDDFKQNDFAIREILIRKLNELGDYRINAHLVNLAVNDDEWIDHMNAYLRATASPLITLRSEANLKRAMRLAPAEVSHKQIEAGPLVSIIMPCFNAEEHLLWAAGSILQQTWRNIELIAVDDCSTDRTPDILRHLAATDARVKLFRTPFNAGPYVAKNIGVMAANGEYITGHDADDWAVPQRIQSQLIHQIALGQPVTVGHMIRISADGMITRVLEPSNFSPDGILSKASISAMFDTSFFRTRLGSWDNVRYGADSELLARAAIALEHPIAFTNILTMFCLFREESLTNQPESRILNGDISGNRLAYRKAWAEWHARLSSEETYLPNEGARRYFDAPLAMRNSTTHIPSLEKTQAI